MCVLGGGGGDSRGEERVRELLHLKRPAVLVRPNPVPRHVWLAGIGSREYRTVRPCAQLGSSFVPLAPAWLGAIYDDLRGHCVTLGWGR